VLAYRDAYLDGDRLLVEYTALVTDDVGAPRGRTVVWAAVRLDDLRATPPPVDSLPVAWLSPDAAHLRRGRRVALWTPPEGGGDGEPPSLPALHVETVGGRAVSFTLHDEARPGGSAVFYSGALTRERTTPWVYPLVPFAAAVDLVVDPVLLFFAPAVIVIGD
jgi:hypothetical protein